MVRLNACNVNGAGQSEEPPMQIDIQTPADAGFALIVAHRDGDIGLTKKAAQFAGQLVAAHEPLSDAQAEWLEKLLNRAGLPANFLGGE